MNYEIMARSKKIVKQETRMGRWENPSTNLIVESLARLHLAMFFHLGSQIRTFMIVKCQTFSLLHKTQSSYTTLPFILFQHNFYCIYKILVIHNSQMVIGLQNSFKKSRSLILQLILS